MPKKIKCDILGDLEVWLFARVMLIKNVNNLINVVPNDKLAVTKYEIQIVWKIFLNGCFMSNFN
jgi:hypothetical protein